MAAVPGLVGLAAGLLGGWWVACWTLQVAALLVLLFFRDPERSPEGDGIISPADGRVVAVVVEDAGHPLEPGCRRRISIFMSPLNVHINRIPASGVVENLNYHRGSFRAAYAPEASVVNESNAISVRAEDGYRYVVVQIAGWLCRRIVCKVTAGQSVVCGQRLGLIMFGSRVDVFLPEGFEVQVRHGQRVKAGHTLIAKAA